MTENENAMDEKSMNSSHRLNSNHLSGYFMVNVEMIENYSAYCHRSNRISLGKYENYFVSIAMLLCE